MGQGSAGYYGGLSDAGGAEEDDFEDGFGAGDALPLVAEERASQNLRSPQFQLAREDDPAEEPPDVATMEMRVPQRPEWAQAWSGPALAEPVEPAPRREEPRRRVPWRPPVGGKAFSPEDGAGFSPAVSRDPLEAAARTTRLPLEDPRLPQALRPGVDPRMGAGFFEGEEDDEGEGAGPDEPAQQRHHLLEMRRAHAAQGGDEFTQLAQDRTALAEHRQRLAEFGRTSNFHANRVRNLALAGAADEVTLTSLREAEQAVVDWEAKNPGYRAALAEADAAEAGLARREQALAERRTRAAAVLGDPVGAALSGVVPETGLVIRGDDAEAASVAAFAARQGLQFQHLPATAHFQTLQALQERGVRTLSGRPIGEELARLAPLARAETTPPPALEDWQKTPAFRALEGAGRVDAVKQWVNDMAQFRKRHDPQFDEQKFRASFIDRPGVLGVLREIGTTLWSGTVDGIPDAIGRTARALSGGVHVQNDQWYDRLIAEQEADRLARGVSLQAASGDELRRWITQGLSSLPLSLATQAAGYVGGRLLGAPIGALAGGAATLVSGPGALGGTAGGAAAGQAIGGKAGAAILTGVVFASLTKDHFEELSLAQFQKENPRGTEEQWQAWKRAHRTEALGWAAGTAEGVSEGIGALIDFGLARRGLKFPAGLAQKYAGQAVKYALARVAPMAEALGLASATEFLEETASGWAGTHLETAGGLRAEPQSLGEVAYEQGLPGGFAGFFQQGTMLAGQGGALAVLRQLGRSPAQDAATDLTQFDTRYRDAIGQLRTAVAAGDTAAVAPQMTAARQALEGAHTAATQVREAVPTDARKTFAAFANPQADFAADEQALRGDPALAFAAATIGRTLRESSSSSSEAAAPETAARQARLAAFAQQRGIPLEVANTIADQHAGLAARRTLLTVLSGHPIDPRAATQLAGLGLLHTPTQANGAAQHQLTDDALPLLPKLIAQKIQRDPSAFAHTLRLTPGAHGDAFTTLVQSGLQRLARAAATGRRGKNTRTSPNTTAPRTTPQPLDSHQRRMAVVHQHLTKKRAAGVKLTPHEEAAFAQAARELGPQSSPNNGTFAANPQGSLTLAASRPDDTGAAVSLSDLLHAFASSDEAWRYSRDITGTTPEEIAAQVSRNGRTITATQSRNRIVFQTIDGHITLIKKANGQWHISAPMANSAGREEGGGSQMYQAAFAWAHNNGIRIHLSSVMLQINRLRRTSNMLSSALRFLTTKHMLPHPEQGVVWSEGHHQANIEALAKRESEIVMQHFPEFRDLTIDPDTLTVRDAEGQRVTDADLKRLIEGRDPGYDQGVGVGTAKRAILTRSATVLPGFRERSRAIGSRLLRHHHRGGLKGSLYSASPDQGARPALSTEQAEAMAREAFAAERELFAALGVQVPKVDLTLDRAAAIVDGRLVINPQLIATDAPANAAGWLQAVLREEIIHLAQLKAAGVKFQATYEAIANDPALRALRAAAARAYAGFEQLSPAAQGAEMVRMVIQQRWTGTITERVFRAIQQVVHFLRGLDLRRSPLLAQTIREVEAALAQAQEQAAAPRDHAATSAVLTERQRRMAAVLQHLAQKRASGTELTSHEEAAFSQAEHELGSASSADLETTEKFSPTYGSYDEYWAAHDPQAKIDALIDKYQLKPLLAGKTVVYGGAKLAVSGGVHPDAPTVIRIYDDGITMGDLHFIETLLEEVHHSILMQLYPESGLGIHNKWWNTVVEKRAKTFAAKYAQRIIHRKRPS